jgi:hypothetical protein
MDLDMDQSFEGQRADLRQLFMEYDLADLESVQFQRLLRLAHAEGRLASMFQELEYSDRLSPSQMGALNPNSLPENPSTHSARSRRLRIASEPWSLKQWFRSISWLRPLDAHQLNDGPCGVKYIIASQEAVVGQFEK